MAYKMKTSEAPRKGRPLGRGWSIASATPLVLVLALAGCSEPPAVLGKLKDIAPGADVTRRNSTFETTI